MSGIGCRAWIWLSVAVVRHLTLSVSLSAMGKTAALGQRVMLLKQDVFPVVRLSHACGHAQTNSQHLFALFISWVSEVLSPSGHPHVQLAQNCLFFPPCNVVFYFFHYMETIAGIFLLMWNLLQGPLKGVAQQLSGWKSVVGVKVLDPGPFRPVSRFNLFLV